MKRVNSFIATILCFLSTFTIFAQEEPDTSAAEEGMKKAIPELKYIKQSGLANAASKIYSADQRFALSGFLELNYVNYLGPKSRASEDIELYYTNLYRSGTYVGYKITDRLIFNSELQVELLHDGFDEFHVEGNLEVIFDYLVNPYFNIRVGNYPIPIGYVNIHEEPTAFYTVNRPEVERLLVPTQWLELGAMFYGNITPKLEYIIGTTKGMDAGNFSDGTWVRRGRFIDFSMPQGIAFNSKIQYDANNFLIGASGYTGNAGNGIQLPDDDEFSGGTLDAQLSMFSSFAEYRWKDFTFFGLYMHGWLSNTDKIYAINDNRVVGKETQGYYGELRWDVLPSFGVKRKEHRHLPIFVRYERLNTHAGVHDRFSDFSRFEREEADLTIWSVGFNYRPKRNIALKANYQFRDNAFKQATVEESDRFEVGIGLIF